VIGQFLTLTASFTAAIAIVDDLLDILTSLAGTWWGSHPHLLLNLYRSIF